MIQGSISEMRPQFGLLPIWAETKLRSVCIYFPQTDFPVAAVRHWHLTCSVATVTAAVGVGRKFHPVFDPKAFRTSRYSAAHSMCFGYFRRRYLTVVAVTATARRVLQIVAVEKTQKAPCSVVVAMIQRFRRMTMYFVALADLWNRKETSAEAARWNCLYCLG